MKITAIEIENIRCFYNVPKIYFSKKINVLIGANNSGKSTIISIINSLQRQILNHDDVTIPVNHSHAKLFFEGSYKSTINPHVNISDFDWIEIRPKTPNQLHVAKLNVNSARPEQPEFIEISTAPTDEPNNIIYTFLSKRKAVEYSTVINENNSRIVLDDFSNLYSKIDRVNDVNLVDENEFYSKACKKILDFQISTKAKGQGKEAGYSLNAERSISLTSMGEGVANIVGLIVNFAFADDKIFLIEEPENDIHPKALKALLELIVDKSHNNQFFISTHSNFVMKYLGGLEETKVFNIINDEKIEGQTNWYKKLRLSRMVDVPNTFEARHKILEDLGYDFFDFGLWEAWLFLEESSAEVIINKLIHWFTPNLVGRVRTFSAGGTSKVAKKFEDFNKLFVFLHLQEIYKNKVWIKLDGGSNEEDIINQMKALYSAKGWRDEKFSQFNEHDFEKYYPKEFDIEVKRVLDIDDKQTQRKAKKELLDTVKAWIKNDEEQAKKGFQESAFEVIEYLKMIDSQL